jgi:hypothetical protein
LEHSDALEPVFDRVELPAGLAVRRHSGARGRPLDRDLGRLSGRPSPGR